MAKKERKASFGMVLPTQQDLQKAEEKRVEIEELQELEASLSEIRNTTFLIDKELSKKFRVHCLDKNISASQMINSFIEMVLIDGLDEKFNDSAITTASVGDHKVTYYIQRGMLNQLRALAINNDTTIREILTYYILKELNLFK